MTWSSSARRWASGSSSVRRAITRCQQASSTCRARTTRSLAFYFGAEIPEASEDGSIALGPFKAARAGETITYQAPGLAAAPLTHAGAAISFAACCEIAAQWRTAGWHAYPDHRDAVAMIVLVQP